MQIMLDVTLLGIGFIAGAVVLWVCEPKILAFLVSQRDRLEKIIGK